MPDVANAAVYYIVFLFAATLHEAAHAWAAKLGGDLTAYHGGQVSLSPIPHIRREPVGMVLLPILSSFLIGWPFGYASAPFSRSWAERHPRRAAWMALAGPAANLVLVLLALVAIRIGAAAGVFFAPESVGFDRIAGSDAGGLWPGVAFFLSVGFSLNLVLATLNLLPLPPLDGSAAIPLLLSDEQIPRYQRFIWSSPGLAWIGIVVAWQLFDVVYQPIFLLAVNLVFPGVRYG